MVKDHSDNEWNPAAATLLVHLNSVGSFIAPPRQDRISTSGEALDETRNRLIGPANGRKCLFNDTLNTFYLWLCGTGHVVKATQIATWATLSD